MIKGSSFALALLVVASACQPTLPPRTTPERPDPEATHFTFLLGEWVQCGDEGALVETWRAEGERLQGGSVQFGQGDGEPTFTETLLLERRPPRTGDDAESAVWYLTAQPHADRPDRPAPTAFYLMSVAEHAAVFKNPAHDFPQVIAYRRQGDVLVAELASVDGARSETIRYRSGGRDLCGAAP